MVQPTQGSAAIIQVCLCAGKVMLENGGETYRVEDTMMRIAASYGIPETQSFVMPTGIMFAVDGEEPATRLVRISRRSTDLDKVARVNEVSRRIGRGEMTVAEAYQQLKLIEKDKHVYPAGLQLAAAAIASGFFLIMYQGRWADVPCAIVAGGLGFLMLAQIGRLTSVRLFAELIAALLVGTVSCLLVRAGIGQDLPRIMIASVMPLVPGLLITNAVRDLMAGHLVSGISKGAEAFLTAFAIGAGIGIALTLNS